ncbi:cytochrome P450 [Amylocystis lapponica]|nr:cytochrome P450 [Amylocystis lapponica]
MRHPDSFYRARFLKDVFHGCVVPSVALFILLSSAHVHLGLLTFPFYVFFIFILRIGKAWYSDNKNASDARRLGARPIPRVVGKWPGNIDLVLELQRASRTSYPGSFYLSLFEQYQSTTLNIKFLWQDLIITMDREHTKYVFATGFDKFSRGRGQKERMENFLGEGIFNRDGEEWKTHRTLARPFFARDRISDFDTFEKYSSSTLERIATLTSSNQPIEAQDLYARFTLDAASEFLFGKNMDTLSGQLPVPGQTRMSAKGSATDDDFGSFAQAFESVQTIIAMRSRRGDWWPMLELGKDETSPHMDVIRQWLQPVVQRMLDHRAEMKATGTQSSPDHSTFLEYLVEHTEDAKVIQDQLLNILIASRDTTACLLTYATYLMSQHQDVATKLREEVLQHCGVDGAPTFQTIKEMRYMRAVINETLRLFHPVFFNIRESRDEPCILPKSDSTYSQPPAPLYLPPNTRVLNAPGLTQQNPALWGSDAHIFDPERWLDDRLTKFTANPMMYLPFSAGPRICIGQNYALNEASYFLARLMQRFDRFTLAPEFQPAGSLPPPEWKDGKGRQPIEKCWPGVALTTFVKGGLWVRFHKAD